MVTPTSAGSAIGPRSTRRYRPGIRPRLGSRRYGEARLPTAPRSRQRQEANLGSAQQSDDDVQLMLAIDQGR